MIKLIKEKYEKKLLNKKWVNGVAIGYKLKNGKINNKKCIIVTVTEKKKKEDLAKEDLVPKRLLGLFRTDVLEVGEMQESANWKAKCRPVRIGASMMWKGGTACSTGLPIWDGNVQYVLMNEHCSNANNKAKVGDAVLQPGPADNGKAEDKVAEITDMRFPVDANNEDNIDMGIVKATEEFAMKDVQGRDYIPETRYLTDKDLLKKLEGGGRTIGDSVTARIIGIDFTAKVRNPEKEIRQFKDCVLCLNSDGEGNPVIMGGDSSSIRFVDNRPLVQTFAGSMTAAIFNQTQKSLDYAEEEFGIKFTLTKPEEPVEGYVAINQEWVNDEKTLVRLNLRGGPKLGDNILKTLPRGTKIEIIEFAGFDSGYFWMEVRA